MLHSPIMKRCLIIFAREPRKGKVKTRLSSVLTQQQSLDLYKAFVRDTLDSARKVKVDLRIVAFDSRGAYPGFIKRTAPDFAAVKQEGRTLGERMHHVILSQQDLKDQAIVIIGSDAPTLPARLINEAFLRLKRADVVLGPSADGGYYLVGLKEPCAGLFRGIRWGSSGVLRSTLARTKKHHLRAVMLDKWYDVDDGYSLGLLLQDLSNEKPTVARHTRRVLSCMDLKRITPL